MRDGCLTTKLAFVFLSGSGGIDSEVALLGVDACWLLFFVVSSIGKRDWVCFSVFLIKSHTVLLREKVYGGKDTCDAFSHDICMHTSSVFISFVRISSHEENCFILCSLFHLN